MTTDTTLLRSAETWTPIDVAEVDYAPFDFADLLEAGESIATVAVTCEVLEGVDASSASRIAAPAEINGTQVRQLISGAVAGVVYAVRCVATLTPPPRKLTITGRLPAVREV